jgi:hypothetical protein
MDAKKNILDYLNKEGFPFEMKVSQTFQKEGFSVNSSVYLEDVTTHKSREIDVIAYKGTLINKHIIFDIKFIIECKYSIQSPWIMFRSNSDKTNVEKYDAMFRNATEMGRIALLEIENTESEKENYLFKIPNNLFYGIRCVSKKSNIANETERNDIPYQALMQVCNGVASSKKYIDDHYNKNFISQIDIFFPLIIVNGLLYECYLGEDSEMVVNEIEQGIIKLEQPNLSDEKFYVRVISSHAMNKIIHKLYQSCVELLNNIDDKFPNTITILNTKNRST